MPIFNQVKSRFESSVCMIRDLDDMTIKETGSQIGLQSNRELFGTAIFQLVDIEDAKLGLDPNNTPPRHADLINWSDDKPKQIEQAKSLAKKIRRIIG